MSPFRLVAALLMLSLLAQVACVEDGSVPDRLPEEEPPAVVYLNPADAFGQLFVDVQLGEVFEDSKTFVDMDPLSEPAVILAAYAQEKGQPGFSLSDFVSKHFAPAKMYAKDFASDATLNLDQHIERLWPVLTREEAKQGQGSLIPLPNDYVVPGGRFREVYYWDSYFTMLGLLVDGQRAYAERMVDNFAWLIDEIGHIPNGNRSYYLSRSQPPFFAPMVGLLAEEGGDSVLLKYLPQLEKEYNWWMRGEAQVEESGSDTLRVARLAAGFTVNRFFDERPRPRPEGFKEDSLTAAEHPSRDLTQLYTDLRAGAESGWDYSSRWFADPSEIGTIRTTRIAPVDLNSLLYYLEDLLAKTYAAAGNPTAEQQFAARAYERRRAVISTFYDPQLRWFGDLDLDTERTTGEATLAGMYPLFFGLATPEQADAVAERLADDFLKQGGLVTSLRQTGQQWDAPNGWPPLQWISIAGLRRYGKAELAKEISSRWLNSGRKVYRSTGKVVEKYNVMDTTLLAGGGEYPNQDGFGWSNGVFARIMHDYPEL